MNVHLKDANYSACGSTHTSKVKSKRTKNFNTSSNNMQTEKRDSTSSHAGSLDSKDDDFVLSKEYLKKEQFVQYNDSNKINSAELSKQSGQREKEASVSVDKLQNSHPRKLTDNRWKKEFGNQTIGSTKVCDQESDYNIPIHNKYTDSCSTFPCQINKNFEGFTNPKDLTAYDGGSRISAQIHTSSLRKAIDNVISRKSELDRRLEQLALKRQREQFIFENLEDGEKYELESNDDYLMEDLRTPSDHLPCFKDLSAPLSRLEANEPHSSKKVLSSLKPEIENVQLHEEKESVHKGSKKTGKRSETKLDAILSLESDESSIPGLGDMGLSSEINSLHSTIQQLVRENRKLKGHLTGVEINPAKKTKSDVTKGVDSGMDEASACDKKESFHQKIASCQPVPARRVSSKVCSNTTSPQPSVNLNFDSGMNKFNNSSEMINLIRDQNYAKSFPEITAGNSANISFSMWEFCTYLLEENERLIKNQKFIERRDENFNSFVSKFKEIIDSNENVSGKEHFPGERNVSNIIRESGFGNQSNNYDAKLSNHDLDESKMKQNSLNYPSKTRSEDEVKSEGFNYSNAEKLLVMMEENRDLMKQFFVEFSSDKLKTLFNDTFSQTLTKIEQTFQNLDLYEKVKRTNELEAQSNFKLQSMTRNRNDSKENSPSKSRRSKSASSLGVGKALKSKDFRKMTREENLKNDYFFEKEKIESKSDVNFQKKIVKRSHSKPEENDSLRHDSDASPTSFSNEVLGIILADKGDSCLSEGTENITVGSWKSSLNENVGGSKPESDFESIGSHISSVLTNDMSKNPDKSSSREVKFYRILRKVSASRQEMKIKNKILETLLESKDSQILKLIIENQSLRGQLTNFYFQRQSHEKETQVNFNTKNKTHEDEVFNTSKESSAQPQVRRQKENINANLAMEVQLAKTRSVLQSTSFSKSRMTPGLTVEQEFIPILREKYQEPNEKDNLFIRNQVENICNDPRDAGNQSLKKLVNNTTFNLGTETQQLGTNATFSKDVRNPTSAPLDSPTILNEGGQGGEGAHSANSGRKTPTYELQLIAKWKNLAKGWKVWNSHEKAGLFQYQQKQYNHEYLRYHLKE